MQCIPLVVLVGAASALAVIAQTMPHADRAAEEPSDPLGDVLLMARGWFGRMQRAWWVTVLLGMAASVGAQPVPVGAVTPPQRADVALQGNVLATLQVASPAACQAECNRIAGCTGYSFSAVTGRVPVDPRSGTRFAPSNCVLLGGALTDLPAKGAVSCRMPCTATAATVPPRPVPGTGTRLPPGTLERPPLQPPTLAPPFATVAPVTPVVVGTYAPPPAPVTPPPAPAPTRRGVSGYEVVPGPMMTLAPLTAAVASAQCPAGKVALSAAHRFIPIYETAAGPILTFADPALGIEVRGAIPEGNAVKVLIRNANVLHPATGQAYAVCVDAILGLRSVERDLEVYGGASGHVTNQQLPCAPNERVVGGGVRGDLEAMLGANAPVLANGAGVWQAKMILSSALRTSVPLVPSRALCAPEAMVDGWQPLETVAVSIGGNSNRWVNLACPADKVMLAAGVDQRGGNLLDMLVTQLRPSQNNPAQWDALIHNRNLPAASGNVEAVFSVVCVRRQ